MGRFISEDPISFAAGDVNLNRYVGNSPTNATDPSGLEKKSIPQVFGDGIWALIWWLLQPRPDPSPGTFPPQTPSNPNPTRPLPTPNPPTPAPSCPNPSCTSPNNPYNPSPRNSPQPIPRPTPSPLPAPRIAPPGTCTQDQHGMLQAAVDHLCNLPRACKGNIKDCETLWRNHERTRACLEARKKINDTCFLGGDAGHRRNLDNERNALNICDEALVKNRCFN